MNLSDLHASWKEVLKSELYAPYFAKLCNDVWQDRKHYQILPKDEDVLKAFQLSNFDEVEVIILGQDPYPNPDYAMGLAFSVPFKQKAPPSLMNIFKELYTSTNVPWPAHGDLTKWAKQGVLLLNSVLTVRAGKSGSHRNAGWEKFTDAVIKKLSDSKSNLIFVLWGNYAKAKKDLIDETKHTVLAAAHPSPLSAHNGFFGCNHFREINRIRKQQGKPPIDWTV